MSWCYNEQFKKMSHGLFLKMLVVSAQVPTWTTTRRGMTSVFSMGHPVSVGVLYEYCILQPPAHYIAIFLRPEIRPNLSMWFESVV